MIIYSHVLQVPALQCRTIFRNPEIASTLCNDANAAGIAEMWRRKDTENAVYLSLSDTVGGAIIINNELYLGENQRGGEFGHTTLVQDGLECYCGKKGCVDAYCSALTLSRHTGGSLDAFFERLSAKDPAIEQVWLNYIDSLAHSLNNIIVSFDCTVILGGYLGEYLSPYIGVIREKVAAITTFPGIEDYITACIYKKEATAVGATLLFVKPFLQSV